MVYGDQSMMMMEASKAVCSCGGTQVWLETAKGIPCVAFLRCFSADFVHGRAGVNYNDLSHLRIIEEVRANWLVHPITDERRDWVLIFI